MAEPFESKAQITYKTRLVGITRVQLAGRLSAEDEWMIDEESVETWLAAFAGRAVRLSIEVVNGEEPASMVEVSNG